MNYNSYMQKIEKQLLAQGFNQAKRITRQASANFYFISLFLPRQERLASYSVYALCRLSDEAVDDDRSSKEQNLENIRKKIHLAYDQAELKDPLLLCFRHTVQKYDIPKKYFLELLDGMTMDLTIKRYQSFNDLFPYCYKAAGVIGLIQLKIFGCQDLIAEQYAINLGIALQLTNILRDVSEDLNRGRIYLPMDELNAHHLKESDLYDKVLNDRWHVFMRAQIRRARSYYEQGNLGLKHIHHKRCRFTAFLILHIYAHLLTKIEQHNYNVFCIRARVSLPEKILLLFSLTNRFFRNNLTFRH
jgi:15-cis-phytoene synthase